MENTYLAQQFRSLASSLSGESRQGYLRDADIIMTLKQSVADLYFAEGSLSKLPVQNTLDLERILRGKKVQHIKNVLSARRIYDAHPSLTVDV